VDRGAFQNVAVQKIKFFKLVVKYIEQHFELEQDFLCTIRKKAVL